MSRESYGHIQTFLDTHQHSLLTVFFGAQRNVDAAKESGDEDPRPVRGVPYEPRFERQPLMPSPQYSVQGISVGCGIMEMLVN